MSVCRYQSPIIKSSLHTIACCTMYFALVLRLASEGKSVLGESERFPVPFPASKTYQVSGLQQIWGRSGIGPVFNSFPQSPSFTTLFESRAMTLGKTWFLPRLRHLLSRYETNQQHVLGYLQRQVSIGQFHVHCGEMCPAMPTAMLCAVYYIGSSPPNTIPCTLE